MLPHPHDPHISFRTLHSPYNTFAYHEHRVTTSKSFSWEFFLIDIHIKKVQLKVTAFDEDIFMK